MIEQACISGLRKTIKYNASLDDTLIHMKRIAKQNAHQVERLAIQLKKATVGATAHAIWDWMRNNTRYKLDTKGIEELRTPLRSIADGARGLYDSDFGIDCDDYTILISALLINMSIPHEYRIVGYKRKGEFQHIYPVAFDPTGKAYIIDCVPEIPRFNYEAQPIIDMKTVNMELQELSGLADVQSDLQEELNQPFTLSGFGGDEDMLDAQFLSGFGEIENEDEADIILSGVEDAIEIVENGLLAEILKARKSLIAEQDKPTILSKAIDVQRELDLMDDVIDAWGDDREETLSFAVDSDSSYANFYKAIAVGLNQLNKEEDALSGLDGAPIYLAKVDMQPYQVGMEGLGRRKKGRLRNLFKKIGKGVKKAVKAVVKYNPASITIRASILLALKTNMMKVASSLIYGYLTEGQAKAQDLNLDEWRKAVDAKNKAEGFFTNIGGNASKFKDAIVRGKAAKKTGLTINGLGVVAATTATAASGFLAFAKKLISKINPSKLFKKVKEKINNKSTNSDGSDASADSFSDPDDFELPQASETLIDTTTPPQERSMTVTDPSNLPSTSDEPQGFLQKVKAFYQKHKKKIVVVGVGGIVSIVALVAWSKYSKNNKSALSGAAAKRSSTKRKRKVSKKRTASKQLKGSTTILKVPSKSIKRARVSKRSNGARLKLMHKKAKQLQKSHPNSKYSTLLKKASKLI